MLMRQKILLALLAEVGQPLSRTVVVKLTFLLRHETAVRHMPAFYDFLPYRFGPFSFVLYRELRALRDSGCLGPEEERIDLTEQGMDIVRRTAGDLPRTAIDAVRHIHKRYGHKSQRQLAREVYQRYPWFASKAEHASARSDYPVTPSKDRCVYTIGYEGKSLDSFFDRLLRVGVQQIVDVRANPISRRYGFSKGRLSKTAAGLDICYRHIPGLGIPRQHRVGLSDRASYQKLLGWYRRTVLPDRVKELTEAATMVKELPTTLLCMEADFQRCHRSCAAEAIAEQVGCEVRHL